MMPGRVPASLAAVAVMVGAALIYWALLGLGLLKRDGDGDG